ncbi:MAG: ABC transporter permease [Dehalococcoidia bacterium]|nr:ABC transporter permease [Dehalococcoidia bacterium]
MALLRGELGLDRPLVVQYVSWLGGVARGDLGKSMKTGRPIVEEIGRRMPLTAQLAIMAVIIGFVAGLPLGIISALKHGSWADNVSRFMAIAFLAFPSFWLGLMVLLVGLRFFNWSPPLGHNLFGNAPAATLIQFIFPSAILGSHLMALVARMTMSTMLEVLREDYIRTARAKGLAEQTIIVRHAMKNAMIPVVTIVSLSVGALLAGTVVMESVFAIPGIGSYLLGSITSRDYTVVQALVLLFALIFIAINLAVDLLYG